MKIPFPLSILSATLAVVTEMMGHFHENGADESASTVPAMTPKRVESYAYAGATDTEIADRLLVEESHLREKFSDLLRTTRAARKLILRQMQFEAAKKSNASLLIWLGRNELGQTTKNDAPGVPEPNVD